MNKYLVEFLGTLFFLYVILATGNWLAIGAALAIAVLIGGPISGGMFNPAVSVMMVSAGKLPKNDLIPYILAQIAGGFLTPYLRRIFNRRTTALFCGILISAIAVFFAGYTNSFYVALMLIFVWGLMFAALK